MKKLVFVLFSLTFIFSFNESCTTAERKEREIQEGNQKTANWFIKHLLYVKDPHTSPPTCYSLEYTGGGGVTSTEVYSHAVVSCMSIPPAMLITAEIN